MSLVLLGHCPNGGVGLKLLLIRCRALFTMFKWAHILNGRGVRYLAWVVLGTYLLFSDISPSSYMGICFFKGNGKIGPEKCALDSQRREGWWISKDILAMPK